MSLKFGRSLALCLFFDFFEFIFDIRSFFGHLKRPFESDDNNFILGGVEMSSQLIEWQLIEWQLIEWQLIEWQLIEWQLIEWKLIEWQLIEWQFIENMCPINYITNLNDTKKKYLISPPSL